MYSSKRSVIAAAPIILFVKKFPQSTYAATIKYSLHFVKIKAAATITGASFILLRLLLRILCLYSFASSHMNPWCAEIAVYTFCTSCIEVAKKKLHRYMHLKNFWFYKKDLLSKKKKDPFEDFNNSGLDIEMNEIGF